MRPWMTESVTGLLMGWRDAEWRQDWHARPVLADAMEDAGYTGVDVLTALRGRVEFVYGKGWQNYLDTDIFSDALKGIHPDLTGYDWREAFEYAKEPDPCPPGSDINVSGFGLADVVEVIAKSEGENDGPNWLCFGRLRDGRYFLLSAGCDYTGWDCQAGGSADVGATAEDVIRFGFGDGARDRLLPLVPG